MKQMVGPQNDHTDGRTDNNHCFIKPKLFISQFHCEFLYFNKLVISPVMFHFVGIFLFTPNEFYTPFSGLFSKSRESRGPMRLFLITE